MISLPFLTCYTHSGCNMLQINRPLHLPGVQSTSLTRSYSANNVGVWGSSRLNTSLIYKVLWIENKVWQPLRLLACSSQGTIMALLSSVVVHWCFLLVCNCLAKWCMAKQLTHSLQELCIAPMIGWSWVQCFPGLQQKNNKCTFFYLKKDVYLFIKCEVIL